MGLSSVLGYCTHIPLMIVILTSLCSASGRVLPGRAGTGGIQCDTDWGECQVSGLQRALCN